MARRSNEQRKELSIHTTGAEGPSVDPPVDVEVPPAVVANHDIQRRHIGDRGAGRREETDQERYGEAAAASIDCTASYGCQCAIRSQSKIGKVLSMESHR
jgi:hypothetical protein